MVGEPPQHEGLCSGVTAFRRLGTADLENEGRDIPVWEATF